MLLSQVSREKQVYNSKQNRFASADQAVQIKEYIYLNLIYFPTTKRLYIVNNYFPYHSMHNLISSSVSIIYFSANCRKRMLNDLLRFDAKDCSWGR